MGTDLQDIFDAFFIKFPSVDFTDKETQVCQIFKTAIAKCIRNIYEDLNYIYDEITQSGYFVNVISASTVELISIYMAKEYSAQVVALMSARKQYIGTQSFNKLPDKKVDFEEAKDLLDFWTQELENFKSEFPKYSDEQ